jgi:hypothetical protein
MEAHLKIEDVLSTSKSLMIRFSDPYLCTNMLKLRMFQRFPLIHYSENHQPTILDFNSTPSLILRWSERGLDLTVKVLKVWA